MNIGCNKKALDVLFCDISQQYQESGRKNILRQGGQWLVSRRLRLYVNYDISKPKQEGLEFLYSLEYKSMNFELSCSALPNLVSSIASASCRARLVPIEQQNVSTSSLKESSRYLHKYGPLALFSYTAQGLNVFGQDPELHSQR